MIKKIMILSLFSFISFSQMNLCGKSDVPLDQANSNSEANIKKPEVSKSNRNIGNEQTIDQIKAETFLIISQLNKEKPSKGIFETKGYVVKITDCPACPPDSICKPCMAENLLISEENKILDNYELTATELIIFTKESETFSKGKEYKFKVKITDKQTTSANLNDFELISAEQIKN